MQRACRIKSPPKRFHTDHKLNCRSNQLKFTSNTFKPWPLEPKLSATQRAWMCKKKLPFKEVQEKRLHDEFSKNALCLISLAAPFRKPKFLNARNKSAWYPLIRARLGLNMISIFRALYSLIDIGQGDRILDHFPFCNSFGFCKISLMAYLASALSPSGCFCCVAHSQ